MARAVAHTLRRALTPGSTKRAETFTSTESTAAPPSTSSFLSSPDTSFSSVSTLSRSEMDGVRRQAVDALVAEYMHMADLVESGTVDASRSRRTRLGLGPPRREPRSIYYEVFGTGTRKLFLIMGMVGSTKYWRLQTRYFADLGDYTVCVFDNCGSGRSTVAAGPYKVTQLARDACLVLARLGWARDIHLVGVSLGGMVAQEMCLMDDRLHFASVALVGTWHSSTMALPTAKEVRFAFNGMSALGSDPRHLINLVFSRRWANGVFHDSFKASPGSVPTSPDAVGNVYRPTNREVMTALFHAIQMELDGHRVAATENTQSMPVPPPKAVTDLLPVHPLAENDKPDAPLHHSRSVGVMCKDGQPAGTGQPRLDTPAALKREVSGDLHQFMACLGHRLSSSRVKAMRTLNPDTRFLVIHGSKDRVIRLACGRALAKLLMCPLVCIQGAGHMPLIDAHATFNLVVRAFTRDEKWMDMVPDRVVVVPPGLSSGKMVDRIGSREMLVVDESDYSASIVPESQVDSPSSICATGSNTFLDPPTRELVLHGALIDTPLRFRRYT
ncbi:hypothetical protein GGI20_005059 [Coemansia sp. BCRC 34301]|nr:hypothetical protein GGI20_005059 [Coemansia sp. BCRC 34301]